MSIKTSEACRNTKKLSEYNVTDIIKTLSGNGSVNTSKYATV
jgi:hypothetical protein